MISKAKGWLSSHLTLVAYTLGVVLFFTFAYLYKLGGQVRGDSPYESIVYLEINGLKDLFESIAFAPIKVMELLMIKINQPNSTLLRLTSALAVVLAVILFFRLIAKWHTARIAFFGTLLFALSTYSLSLARFTNQDALYYVVIPFLLLAGTWLKSKRYVKRMVFIFPAIALLLYLPGIIFVLLPLGILFKTRLLLAWRFVSKKTKIIGLSTAAIIIAPLITSLVVYPAQIPIFLGIDRLTSGDFKGVLNAFIDVLNALFWNGPDQSYRWLSGTPILDIASTVLLVLGIYAYVRGTHTLRSRLLGLLFVLLLFPVMFGSLVSIAVLIPLLYVVIAAGVAYLLQTWFTVFPRNPAARNTAIICMVVLIGLICSYQLQRYFIAWPNAPATKKALNVQLKEVVQ